MRFSAPALAAAAVILLALHALGRRRVRSLWPYLIGAALLWYAVLLSGVHATVAGVLAASAVPALRTPGAPDSPDSPLHRLEHGIGPWVAFLIVPLFGFANAGVPLVGVGLDRLLAAAPGLAALPVDEVCDELLLRLAPDLTDDIALLAVRVRDGG